MPSPPDPLLETLKSLARKADSRAIEASLAASDPERAAEALATAQRDLYWTDKDIPAVVTLSRAGIAHLLKIARQSPEDTPEANRAGHEAKALAFNLGSFTWPGWAEPGITLTPADIAAGFEAARLNLRLAEELHRPEKAKAKAHWLLGAQQLSAADFASAADSFRIGKTHAAQSDDPMLARMLDGYLLLTHLLADPPNEQARRDFDAAVTALRKSGSEDSREYANQLTTALAALSKLSKDTPGIS
jgi:hypothetical protein